RPGRAGGTGAVRSGDLMMVVAALATALQRRRHFVEADRTVAVLAHLAEHVVGLRDIGAAGAERVLEFGFAELAVAVGIDLREQVFQRGGFAGGGCGCGSRCLALRRQQRAHRRRRYLRPTAGTGSWRRAWSGRGGAGEIERVGRVLAPGRRRRGRFRRGQRFEGVQCGRRGATGEQHGQTPKNAAGRGLYFDADGSANPVPLQKPKDTGGFCGSSSRMFPAIDAVAADFSALDTHSRCIAPGPDACYPEPFRTALQLPGKRTCLSNLRHAPSSSPPRSWHRTLPGWAKRYAPSMRPAPTGSIST